MCARLCSAESSARATPTRSSLHPTLPPSRVNNADDVRARRPSSPSPSRAARDTAVTSRPAVAMPSRRRPCTVGASADADRGNDGDDLLPSEGLAVTTTTTTTTGRQLAVSGDVTGVRARRIVVASS